MKKLTNEENQKLQVQCLACIEAMLAQLNSDDASVTALREEVTSFFDVSSANNALVLPP